MKKTKLLLTLLCAAGLFVGCNEDDNNGGGNGPSDSNFEQNFGSSVSRDFIGQVVDMGNQPVQGATVKIGSSTVQTDSNGMFFVNDASVKQKFAYVTVDKMGYFQGSRSLVPTSGKNSVKIMLVPNTPTATVSSGQTSEVTTDSGTKLLFDGSFEDENGNAYSGDVAVSVFHLKPSDVNISQLMPGMLYAERENGNEAALETFGMINVELRGSGGQKLQPAEGHPAGIEVAIDATQSGTAPATIPLWHFDAEKGWWKEDGVAIRQGNKYVGQASHFSWWNCDAPFPLVQLTITLTDADGNPIGHTGIGISFSGSNWPTMGYTNADGVVSGLVPSNETLTINVYNMCHQVVSTSTQGPFTSDSNIAITASGGSAQTALVQGTLLTCDGSNVTDGYVLMHFGGVYNFAEVTNGSFSFSALVCTPGQTFTLEGGDYDSLQQTDSITYTFTTPVTNVGNLQACNAIDEFISYQIDNQPTVMLIQEVSGSTAQGGLAVSGWNDGGTSNGESLHIWGNGVTAPGVYTTAQFALEGSLGYVTSGVTNDLVFTVTSVGAIGEYIDLTFSGTYEDFDGVTRTITGVAHAIRAN
ncbi:hypothetical protein [Flavobacterium selenitireducens]|uniref:hypothetical protein n=1 Tax=Flavobacterium selenitireducens TaxID=2722704 RepID=UPI00168B4963|nr:hypothetical protein [Flavobacterium selenitireducens]MBD3581138.1 hypothetical protein [Flavobacterium selenitireducens]